MDCQHYWVIETNHGLTSVGQCKKCGLRKEFSNNWPVSKSAGYVPDSLTKRKAKTGGRRKQEAKL